jgi:hypothetical protein
MLTQFLLHPNACLAKWASIQVVNCNILQCTLETNCSISFRISWIFPCITFVLWHSPSLETLLPQSSIRSICTGGIHWSVELLSEQCFACSDGHSTVTFEASSTHFIHFDSSRQSIEVNHHVLCVLVTRVMTCQFARRKNSFLRILWAPWFETWESYSWSIFRQDSTSRESDSALDFLGFMRSSRNKRQ